MEPESHTSIISTKTRKFALFQRANKTNESKQRLDQSLYQLKYFVNEIFLVKYFFWAYDIGGGIKRYAEIQTHQAISGLK